VRALKNNPEKSKRGGARPGAGRPKGSPNKATAGLRDLARKYTDGALETLSTIMDDKNAPAAARVSAANALLDRGYGKPSQVLSGDEEGGPIKVARIERIIVPAKA
jgi:hypothetical protein